MSIDDSLDSIFQSNESTIGIGKMAQDVLILRREDTLLPAAALLLRATNIGTY